MQIISSTYLAQKWMKFIRRFFEEKSLFSKVDTVIVVIMREIRRSRTRRRRGDAGEHGGRCSDGFGTDGEKGKEPVAEEPSTESRNAEGGGKDERVFRRDNSNNNNNNDNRAPFLQRGDTSRLLFPSRGRIDRAARAPGGERRGGPGGNPL